MNFLHYIKPNSYEHWNVVLAQGLSELGHENFSLLDYWVNYSDGKFLFKKYSGEKVDAIIVSSVYLDENRDVLEFLKKSQDIPQVLIDSSDGGAVTTGSVFAAFFDFVLKCHFNVNMFGQKNFVPWQFSLTNHQIGWLENIARVPSDKIEVNFRNFHQIRSKGVRILRENIPDNLKLSFNHDEQNTYISSKQGYSEEELHYLTYTFSRCNPRFYERLSRSALAPVFGGFFFDSTRFQLKRQINRILVKTNVRVPRTVSLAQFDSWRLWESAFLGLPMIHFNFDLYGAKFPIQPTNGKDYFGVDINGRVNNIPLSEVLNNSYNVGLAGREWARSNFRPISIATRFLELLY